MGNVKFFRSTDYGAPQLYGNAGYLIGVLDACLVNGYGVQAISTLTHDNNIVTAVTSVAHGISQYSRQTISGANESGYNGEFVVNIIDTYSFYYTTSGISVSPATGTLSTKSESAGWTKPFSGTNLAAYRPAAGPRHFLRIDDTVTMASRCIGYENMTAVSTGTGPFPTSAQVTGGLYWQKTNVADAISSRSWIIIADDRTMYMWVQYAVSNNYDGFSMTGFGEFTSYKSGDAYNTFISANTGASSYQHMYFMYLNNTISAILNNALFAFYVARPHTQIGSSVACGKLGDYSKSTQNSMGSATVGNLPYPHPVDGGLHMCAVYIGEGAGTAAQAIVRGYMRGIWNPLHAMPLNDEDIFDGNGDLAGKKFIALNGCGTQTNLSQCMFDISLTW